ncbi:MAG: type II secretion system protein [Parcubacteria group bacterium]|nr:type II secretion system protein [Parcubacteria group bacterium]
MTRFLPSKGFTLIELLVVIAIIGVLSSVVLASLNTARAKARDASRKVELRQMQTALELYRSSNTAYPTTGGAWWGMSVNGGSRTTSGANAYIPGVTPTYISALPADPSGQTSGWSGYLYLSDGANYKLLSHATGPESFPAVGETFYDPVRPTWAWMLCSDEPACSSW